MKKPNKQERNRIYGLILEYYNKHGVIGFCKVLTNVLIEYYPDDYGSLELEDFKELWKHRPSDEEVHSLYGYWFPINNKTIRVNIVKQAKEETNITKKL